MQYNDQEILRLMYKLAGQYPYNPPSYTCIKEFTDSFPKTAAPEFNATPPLPEPEWQPESPYPRIYTKDYRKTILSTLKQPIGKT